MMDIASDRTPVRHSGGLHRLDWSVQITSQKMPGGTGYHVFRCGNNFLGEISKLAQWLSRARQRVWIADAERTPSLVITIEPLDTVLEQEFIATVGRFLVE